MDMRHRVLALAEKDGRCFHTVAGMLLKEKKNTQKPTRRGQFGGVIAREISNGAGSAQRVYSAPGADGLRILCQAMDNDRSDTEFGRNTMFVSVSSERRVSIKV